MASGLQAVRQIKGVKLPKLAEGGLVRGEGTGTSDSIPAMLSNGESVINARSTAMFGPILSALNQAGGGRPFEGDLSPRETSTNGPAPVVKTYVVAGDVSNEVELERQVKSRSII